VNPGAVLIGIGVQQQALEFILQRRFFGRFLPDRS
jgi:hypothetical protein